MYKFGRTSMAGRETCHKLIQQFCDRLIKSRNARIIHGWRSPDVQNTAYRNGFSTKRWPYSMHNVMELDNKTGLVKPCSIAVDLMPFFDIEPNIRWNDEASVYEFSGYVKATAYEDGIFVRHGYDWDMDLDFHDQTFMDGAHYELLRGRTVETIITGSTGYIFHDSCGFNGDIPDEIQLIAGAPWAA